MAAEKSSIEDATGQIGIGTLELLGLLAFIDARSGFYDLVKVYMKTPALFALPTVALAYVLGLCTVVVWTEATLSRSPLTAGLLSRLIASKAETLLTRYNEAERQSRLLGGSTVALLVLGAGILAEIPKADRFCYVALGAGASLCCLGLACGFLARKVQRRAAHFIEDVLGTGEG